MPIKITNLASTAAFVPLNSGPTLRLSPGETSEELADVEIKSNSHVEKLQKLHLIAVELLTHQSSSSSPKEAKSKSETSAKEKSTKPKDG